MPKSISSMPPNVEARLSGWEQIQHRMTEVPDLKVRPSITLSRQFGCEGFPLAERLKALLETASGEPWNIYDKLLLEKVAADEGLSMRVLKGLGRRSALVDALGLDPGGKVTHDAAFDKVARMLVQVAKAGNAIAVGRGGVVLCKELKNCYHFRLEAPVEFRVASIVKRLEIPEKEAQETVRTQSQQREQFIEKTLRANLGDLRNYDAVFNNARHSLDDIASAIVAYVKRSWPDPTYFRQ